ncbi:MAG: hypothetical protein ACODAU_06500 [Myxococcota bacterium]
MRAWVVGALVFAGLVASPAAAQEDGADRDDAEAQGDGVEWEEDPGPPAPSLEEEQAQVAKEPERSATDPYEDPTKAHYFLGLFYRHTWTPAFVLNLFLDDITTANNPATGLEFTYRKDNLDITTTVYWQRFHTYGPFRASGDPRTDTEMIDSTLSTVSVGANFLWSTPFNDVFALQYGLDLGLGVVLGDLRRTEAYPTNDGSVAGQKAGWAPCIGPGNPVSTDSGYCEDNASGHYDVLAKRWTDGGSIPNVWFRLALPHLALRIKPIRQLVMRVDFGFDLFSGFFLGAGVAAGLN